MRKFSEFHRFTILQVITCILIILAIWWFNYKRAPTYVTDPSMAKELRQANAEQRLALAKQEEEAEKTAQYNHRRDSINDLKLSQNNSAIQKTLKQTNEKINAIRYYNSAELERAFSEFTEK